MNYLLRNIDPDLWKRAKHAAVDLNITLRGLVLSAIEDYLKTHEKGGI